MNKAEKAENIETFKEAFSRAKGVFLTDFRGIPVADLTTLRFELKKAKTDLKVVKNRIALKALEDKELGEFKKHFDYMTAVALTYGDVAAGAKVLSKFAKENEKLKLRAGYVEGKVISLEQVRALASLPSRQELLGKLLGTLSAVPTGFVRVLNGLPAKWVYLLQAIKDKKEKGA